MKINVIVEKKGYMPVRAHDTDAGWDLKAPFDFVLACHDYYRVDTGVHVEIPKGYVGFIKSKSGLNVNRGIRAEGVIDSGYTGSIVVKMYNDSDYDHQFYAGDKITQLVFLPIPEVELVQVEEFAETDRGDGGFGSTGR